MLIYIHSIFHLLYIMIFNSISKEINQNKFAKSNYHNVHYQPSVNSLYRSYTASNSLADEPLTSSNGSNISQMNQKIIQNIEYLKYKDHIRQKDLRSSRLSNRSNRSLQSNRSHHSIHSSSRVSPLKIQGRHIITTKQNQHYFPQIQSYKFDKKPWETKVSNSFEAKPINSQTNTEYRQFLRKPVTINLNNGKDSNIPTSNFRGIYENYEQKWGLAKTKTSGLRSKTDAKDIDINQIQFDRYMPNKISSPIYKSCASNLYNGITKTSERFPVGSASRLNPEPQMKPEKQNVIEKLSPLPQTTNKKGLIVAAGLIAFGFILLLLQIYK